MFQFTQLQKEIIFHFVGIAILPTIFWVPRSEYIAYIPRSVDGLLPYSFLLSLSLFERCVDVSNIIREEFECTIHEVICDKADTILLMIDTVI